MGPHHPQTQDSGDAYPEGTVRIKWASTPSDDETSEVIVPDSDDERAERELDSEREGVLPELMIGLTPMPTQDAGAILH